MRERLFLCPHGSKTHLLLMLENNCKYYAQMFGGVILALYICPIIHTKKCDTVKNINEYIQPLRGKFIDSDVAVSMFPYLGKIVATSKENEAAGKMIATTFYALFVDGYFSFSTWSYDDASDFLLDTQNSQGFQVNYLTGLSVCADQSK